jgi:hypothetical protein
MPQPSVRAFVLAATLVTSSSGAHAQSAAIETGATAALEKMGTYLRTLTVFQVVATTTDEDVLDNGQKIQYAGVTTILARKPANLRAQVVNDRQERVFLYDGKNFTLFAPRLNYYAVIAAPPTILQLANTLSEKYDFTVPLEDLFQWGSSGKTADNIKAAIDVGPSVIDGTTCEQYAFSQDDIDWQIWIQRGDYPLPRRLVITTKTDEARPQHTAVYIWNLAPSFNEAAFKFDPPQGAQRVVIAESEATAGAVK